MDGNFGPEARERGQAEWEEAGLSPGDLVRALHLLWIADSGEVAISPIAGPYIAAVKDPENYELHLLLNAAVGDALARRHVGERHPLLAFDDQCRLLACSPWARLLVEATNDIPRFSTAALALATVCADAAATLGGTPPGADG